MGGLSLRVLVYAGADAIGRTGFGLANPLAGSTDRRLFAKQFTDDGNYGSGYVDGPMWSDVHRRRHRFFYDGGGFVDYVFPAWSAVATELFTAICDASHPGVLPRNELVLFGIAALRRQNRR